MAAHLGGRGELARPPGLQHASARVLVTVEYDHTFVNARVQVRQGVVVGGGQQERGPSGEVVVVDGLHLDVRVDGLNQ